MTQTQKYLRMYIRLQAILLCLILGSFGACLAAQRTQYIADGTQTDVRQETLLPEAVETLSRRLSDMPDRKQIAPYLSALPAPYGCMVGIVCSVWEMLQTASGFGFGNVHK